MKNSNIQKNKNYKLILLTFEEKKQKFLCFLGLGYSILSQLLDEKCLNHTIKT